MVYLNRPIHALPIRPYWSFLINYLILEWLTRPIIVLLVLLGLLATTVLLVLLVLVTTIVLVGSHLRTYHRAVHMVSFMWIDHMVERAAPIHSFLSERAAPIRTISSILINLRYISLYDQTRQTWEPSSVCMALRAHWMHAWDADGSPPCVYVACTDGHGHWTRRRTFASPLA